MARALKKGDVGNALWVAALVVMSVPFALYAFERGLAVGSFDEQTTSRLFHDAAPVSNLAIYGHMIAGAVITALAPLQLLSAVRARWPAVHRLSGYLVAAAAAFTAFGGLYYILVQGTIGGWIMDAGFGLYGALMLLTVVRTVQLARQRDPRHRLWAERLVILALASWLYRVHYGIWDIATGGIGSNPAFSGPFDIVQVFAFYVPYLLLHAWFWQRRSSVRHQLA